MLKIKYLLFVLIVIFFNGCFHLNNLKKETSNNYSLEALDTKYQKHYHRGI